MIGTFVAQVIPIRCNWWTPILYAIYLMGKISSLSMTLNKVTTTWLVTVALSHDSLSLEPISENIWSTCLLGRRHRFNRKAGLTSILAIWMCVWGVGNSHTYSMLYWKEKCDQTISSLCACRVEELFVQCCFSTFVPVVDVNDIGKVASKSRGEC